MKYLKLIKVIIQMRTTFCTICSDKIIYFKCDFYNAFNILQSVSTLNSIHTYPECNIQLWTQKLRNIRRQREKRLLLGYSFGRNASKCTYARRAPTFRQLFAARGIASAPREICALSRAGSIAKKNNIFRFKRKGGQRIEL